MSGVHGADDCPAAHVGFLFLLYILRGRNLRPIYYVQYVATTAWRQAGGRGSIYLHVRTRCFDTLAGVLMLGWGGFASRFWASAGQARGAFGQDRG